MMNSHLPMRLELYPSEEYEPSSGTRPVVYHQSRPVRYSARHKTRAHHPTSARPSKAQQGVARSGAAQPGGPPSPPASSRRSLARCHLQVGRDDDRTPSLLVIHPARPESRMQTHVRKPTRPRRLVHEAAALGPLDHQLEVLQRTPVALIPRRGDVCAV
jgi:hypothetical protein